MTSWYTRPPSTQGQANGESHVLDPLQINAVTYQQEAVGNHLLDLNKTLPVPYAPNTPNKFSEVVSGSPDKVVGLAQASDPGGAQASFISLLQQNAAVMQASYTENPLLSNGKISDPYMLSGYHQTPSPRGSFSIQYKNNIYYSPEATARVAATRMPPFPFAFSMQNPCQGINDNTLKTNAVGVTSPPFDSRVTQSGSPMSFDRSHLSHSGTSSFSFFKPIGQTSLRTENTILDLNETNSIPSAPITPEKMKISTHNPAIEAVIWWMIQKVGAVFPRGKTLSRSARVF